MAATIASNGIVFELGEDRKTVIVTDPITNLGCNIDATKARAIPGKEWKDQEASQAFARSVEVTFRLDNIYNRLLAMDGE